jgi:predicted nucleic acid-binding protein
MISICDTGPLLAYLNRNDPHHVWAVALMKQVRAPMLVCEPVLTEVVYFLREDGLAVDPLFQLLERQAVRLEFDISAHWPRLRTLMSRYRHDRVARQIPSANHRSPGLQRVSTERPPGDSFRLARER